LRKNPRLKSQYTEIMASVGPSAEMALYTGLVLIVIWVVYRLYISFLLHTKEGFEGGSVSGGSYKLVMYYADWCGHCKNAKPEFNKLGATKTIGGKIVEIQAVNPDTNPEAAEGKNIRGYPTIHLYSAKGNLVQEYQGERTHEGFVEFLNENVK